MFVKLKELGSFSTGSTIPIENGTYPAYGGNGIIRLTSAYNVEMNNIIIGRVGANCGCIHLTKEKSYISDNALIFSPNHKINPYYAYYYLSNLNLNKLHIGSSQPLLTQGILGELIINNLPTIQQQQKIANILWKIDNQIERNNTMVNKLQVLAQSTFHYFFANFASKKEPLSSFIVEYKKSMLQVNEVEDTNGAIPFFTSGDTVKYIDRNLVDGFNLFLSTGGNASVKSYYGKASYSTDTWCITAKNDMQFYIFEYLKMIENQMDSLYFHGTGLKHLQKPLFLNSEIPVPVENLSKYNTIVEPIFKKISDIQKGIIKLNKLKNKLLPLLMNQQLQ